MNYEFVKVVNAGILAEEIRASAITVALDCISTVEDTQQCTITFKGTLSTEESAILDALVDAHVFKEVSQSVNVNISNITNSKIEKAMRVEVTTPEGSSTLLTSHNFCDKTTWYTKSVAVENELLTKIGDNQYKTAHDFIIDLEHGKLSYEDRIAALFAPIFKVNGQTITPVAIDYKNGIITTNGLTNEDVYGDYHYATTSEWEIKPITGRILKLEGTYVQLSSNLVFENNESIVFQVYAGETPVGYPTVYKNLDDLFDCATGNFERMAGFALSGGDRTKIPFKYTTSKDLDPRMQLKVVIKCGNDLPLNGTRATVVAYGKSVEV